MSDAVQIDALIALWSLLRHATRWLLNDELGRSDIAGAVGRYASGVAELWDRLPEALSATGLRHWEERLAAWRERGLPGDIAEPLAGSAPMSAALDVVEIAQRAHGSVTEAARAYFALGDALHLHWLLERIESLEVEGFWHANARGALRDELLSHQRTLTVALLERMSGRFDPQVLADWVASSDPAMRATRAMLESMRSLVRMDLCDRPRGRAPGGAVGGGSAVANGLSGRASASCLEEGMIADHGDGLALGPGSHRAIVEVKMLGARDDVAAPTRTAVPFAQGGQGGSHYVFPGMGFLQEVTSGDTTGGELSGRQDDVAGVGAITAAVAPAQDHFGHCALALFGLVASLEIDRRREAEGFGEGGREDANQPKDPSELHAVSPPGRERRSIVTAGRSQRGGMRRTASGSTTGRHAIKTGARRRTECPHITRPRGVRA